MTDRRLAGSTPENHPASSEESGRDLVDRARTFAVQAHTHIGHRRKYTAQPYAEHLQHVAALVASVTDDPETLAAAWLHDVVEDTTATLEDVEAAFGPRVAALVESLTDVSRPSDGNRAARKALDRQHLARAEAKTKTVKLADLIDNCQDIARHDPRFARVYLGEMAALLEVLAEGDARLLARARRVHARWVAKLPATPAAPPRSTEDAPHASRGWRVSRKTFRVFTDAFHARDIAEPLRVIEAESPGADLAGVLDDPTLEIVGIRQQGAVASYARRGALAGGTCEEHLRRIRPAQVVPGEGSLGEVVHVLTLHEYAFVSAAGEIVGCVGRGGLNTPIGRMWLFGIVTLVELELVRIIEEFFPAEGWRPLVPPGRLQKAVALREERARRDQPCRLVDCLQFSDKAQILLEHPEGLALFALGTKRKAKQVLREMESLRNNLAHAQDVAACDWASIARIAAGIEEAVTPREPPVG